MPHKQLFDVAVSRTDDALHPSRIMIVLADYEGEARSLVSATGKIHAATAYEAAVAAVGPGRIIGEAEPGGQLYPASQAGSRAARKAGTALRPARDGAA